jgi:molybdopterin-containing oxidoreductase family iron-sulfur binding subunit
MDRRVFLKLLGSSGAAATLAGCGEPVERILPLVRSDEDRVPGVAAWYATVCRECPAGCGLLVRTREGRAVKVEGNPAHPVNGGGLCARGQASLQGLYNPDRIRHPIRREPSGATRPITWAEAEGLLADRLAALGERRAGARVAFVGRLETGSLRRLVGEFLAAIGSPWHLTYEPFAYEPLRAANRIVFGRDALPRYQIEAARFLLAFDADFLETWISPVEFARAFARFRTVREGTRGGFVYVGPRLNLTAANADTWIPIRPGTEGVLALGMMHVILQERLVEVPGLERERLWPLARAHEPAAVAQQTDVPAETVRSLAGAFVADRPSLALAGGIPTSGATATAGLVAVNHLNALAGNVGRTVRFGPDASLGTASPYADLRRLIAAMGRGEVEVLLLHDVNPLFTLPAAAGFAEALAKVPLVVSLSSSPHETALRSHLVLPEHTPLESWGDYAPREGLHGLLQPVMAPLFDSQAAGDLLLAVAKRMGGTVAAALPAGSFAAYLREAWRGHHRRLAPDLPFEAFWEEALKRGGVWEAVPAEPVRVAAGAGPGPAAAPELRGPADGLALLAYPSASHFDGRGANRPWLQELPDPLTQIAWDAWAEVHPETARRLGVGEGDVVRLTSPHGQVELPARLTPGLRRDAVAVPIGQGHTAYGRYAERRGANPIALLAPEAEGASGGTTWLSVRVALARTGARRSPASAGGSAQALGPGVARTIGLAELGRPAPEAAHPEASLYPAHEHPDHRWGMAIDLNACTGCGACVVACAAENNIPVVGPERVSQGRIMAWIRIERSLEAGPAALPRPRFAPMLCQHCDHAPCEAVCPVFATYHTAEGLNAQVYNRCVGTRYCANNCPYKVRRFNWQTYPWPAPLHLQLNPDVSVREMGVMEKCTFCVQRIRDAKDQAKDEGRRVRDGEIIPACAQSCPASAIAFGDLKDPHSRVSRLSRDRRGYHVLGELGTRPAITYLKRVVLDSSPA